MTTDSKIVPISPIMSVGPVPKTKPRCGANTPVTWGELYLMFTEMGRHDMANAALEKIVTIDQYAAT